MSNRSGSEDDLDSSPDKTRQTTPTAAASPAHLNSQLAGSVYPAA